MVGLGIAAFGALCLAVALVSTGGLLESSRFGSSGGGNVEGVGWLALLVGGGLFVYGTGRVGPEQQQSCCGCSCAVALLALPVGLFWLWSAGGPALAALAIPAWVPLVWLLDFATAASVRLRGIALVGVRRAVGR